jgi:hypothetical protein
MTYLSATSLEPCAEAVCEAADCTSLRLHIPGEEYARVEYVQRQGWRACYDTGAPLDWTPAYLSRRVSDAWKATFRR